MTQLAIVSHVGSLKLKTPHFLEMYLTFLALLHFFPISEAFLVFNLQLH